MVASLCDRTKRRKCDARFDARIRRIQRVCTAPVLITGILLGMLGGCDEHKPPAAATPNPAVGVRPATLKGVSQSFDFVGHIKAVNKVDARARVEGFLEKLLFREGQTVKTGDLLYQIEKVQFQA